jgi:hypothetical protein
MRILAIAFSDPNGIESTTHQKVRAEIYNNKFRLIKLASSQAGSTCAPQLMVSMATRLLLFQLTTHVQQNIVGNT